MNSTHPNQLFRGILAAVAILGLPVVVMAQTGNAAPVDSNSSPEMPSLLNLAIQGGWFMIPIGIASIITVMFTIERLNGLRREQILPRQLIEKLRGLMNSASVDPRKLWETCQNDNSPLANVARAAVLKTGRPQPEVEESVMDAVRRETKEMTRNLRPINVVASIAPLLGLLGTVQGMIMAFMVTSTTSSTGSAKAQELAHGIYTALVTTFAGLCVAVVSVILANFLEGRIERLLSQMETIFLDLLPRLESFEGRLRVAESTDAKEGGIRVRTNGAVTAVAATAVAAKPAAAESPPAPRTQTTRKLGSPKRTKRKASSPKPENSVPAPVSKGPSPDGELLPEEKGALETLRANFDR